MKIFFFLLLTVFLTNCTQKKCETSDWRIVYKNDADGKMLQGDKSVLIDAARMGYPIRIGFGGRSSRDTTWSIEHIADAEFLTIVNGKEVFGQIDDIYGQRPRIDSDTLQIALKHENMWTLLIGTNGERSTLSRYFVPDNDEHSKRGNRGATWYVKLPNNYGDRNVAPLW